MIGMNIGVDFGSSSTIMVVDGKGIVLDEPTVIAVDSETKYPIAFGNNAYTIEGRTDDNIEVIHPVVNGVISNYTMAQKLLGHYLPNSRGSRIPKAVRMIILLSPLLPARFRGVVYADSKHVFPVKEILSYIKRKTAITARMSAHELLIDIDLALPIYRFKMKKYIFAL